MEAGDFVLYDEQGGNEEVKDAAPFQRPGFWEHRGQLPDTSPLLDAAPHNLHLQSHLSKDSPATLKSGSPYNTPPQNPSSGTLGAPLNLLSLQTNDGDSTTTPKMPPLFPSLPSEQLPPDSSRVVTPPAHQTPDIRAWAAALGDMDAAASFLWKPGAQGKDNLRRWKSYWRENNAHGFPPSVSANPDLFHDNETGAYRPATEKLTVSPRDLHLDYNEANTPPAKHNNVNLFGDMVPLFSSQPSLDLAASQATPLSLSSGMETGSSTEEEDDEDEKPFHANAVIQDAPMGITKPNEQLLEQWSRPMYGTPPQNIPESRELPSEGNWPMLGPTFSSVSTSSDSEDDLPNHTGARMHKTRNGTEPLGRTNSGAMTGYGYIPSSQDSTFGTGTDMESVSGSQMSVSATESEPTHDDDNGRSPSILNSAQAITPATDQEQDASHPMSIKDSSTGIATFGPSSRSHQKEASPSSVIPSSSTAQSSESSSSELDADSDYEQTHHMSPAPHRTTARRGRPPRTVSSARGSSATNPLHRTAGHPFGTSPTSNHNINRGNTSSPVSGSAIRCDYVSPVTHQVCGTIFHRMYDLARHRITLHLREEAQLVKDGLLKVDQCIVLGKEVDVQKALAELEWTCRICGATFSRKDAMLRHERLRHHR